MVAGWGSWGCRRVGAERKAAAEVQHRRCPHLQRHGARLTREEHVGRSEGCTELDVEGHRLGPARQAGYDHVQQLCKARSPHRVAHCRRRAGASGGVARRRVRPPLVQHVCGLLSDILANKGRPIRQQELKRVEHVAGRGARGGGGDRGEGGVEEGLDAGPAHGAVREEEQVAQRCLQLWGRVGQQPPRDERVRPAHHLELRVRCDGDAFKGAERAEDEDVGARDTHLLRVDHVPHLLGDVAEVELGGGLAVLVLKGGAEGGDENVLGALGRKVQGDAVVCKRLVVLVHQVHRR
mmetsp:Transcript_18251/g.31490  ORF Transcript_18251/g.31490 Transcript_18251/m.31490 type:complete len:294 (-) Transcript_18251:155-1036(-)